MLKIFLDANVWIAGAGSPTGGSRQILDWGERQLIQVVTSQTVLTETRRNVMAKLPRAIEVFERIIEAVSPKIVVEPSSHQIKKATIYIDTKDAPILAASIKANVDYFVTLDIRHFKIKAVQRYAPFPIVTPGEFVIANRIKLERK